MSKLGGIQYNDFSSSSYSFYGGNKASSTSASQAQKESATSKKSFKVDPNDYVPKRFAIKYDPPTIILEYLVPSSGKLYHHKMKMSNLKHNTDTDDAVEALQKRNTQYFVNNKISDVQIKKFVERLKKKLQETQNKGSSTATWENSKGGSAGGKLAPISGTPTNFGKKDNALASSDINKDRAGAFNSRNSSAEKSKSAQKTGFWDFDALEDFEDDAQNSGDEIDYNNTNLNKLSQEEVQKHKNKMDVLFNKNQKKPGDTGFIYDKQEEFVPTGDNEWDEDEDF